MTVAVHKEDYGSSSDYASERDEDSDGDYVGDDGGDYESSDSEDDLFNSFREMGLGALETNEEPEKKCLAEVLEKITSGRLDQVPPSYRYFDLFPFICSFHPTADSSRS